MAKDERLKNETIGETTDKGLPLPEKLGTVNSNWFTELIETIDELFYTKAENEKDKEELLKIFGRVEQSIRDHANDYNIITSDTFDGSQPVLSDYLKKLKAYVLKLRADADKTIKATSVYTNKRYAGATQNTVESVLEAIDKAIASAGQTIDALGSDSIKHKTTTVYNALENNEGRILELEGKVGSGLEAKNIRTESRYQGSSQNVESALGAIDKQVTTNKAELTNLEDEVSKLQSGSEVPLTSDIIRHSSANIKAKNVKDALEELFTYADDVHAKWASSVGSPLTKSMTATEKENETKKLINSFRGQLERLGVDARGKDDLGELINLLPRKNVKNHVFSVTMKSDASFDSRNIFYLPPKSILTGSKSFETSDRVMRVNGTLWGAPHKFDDEYDGGWSEWTELYEMKPGTSDTVSIQFTNPYKAANDAKCMVLTLLGRHSGGIHHKVREVNVSLLDLLAASTRRILTGLGYDKVQIVPMPLFDGGVDSRSKTKRPVIVTQTSELMESISDLELSLSYFNSNDSLKTEIESTVSYHHNQYTENWYEDKNAVDLIISNDSGWMGDWKTGDYLHVVYKRDEKKFESLTIGKEE